MALLAERLVNLKFTELSAEFETLEQVRLESKLAPIDKCNMKEPAGADK
jgi:hypothetical protein